MSQQIGVNLEKNCNFGPIWALFGPPGTLALQKKIVFCWKFQTMTHCESLYCFQGYFSKNTKNSSEKRGKRAFWAQFWANFDQCG